jgi:SAM-dependent methyltransferase
MCTNGTLSPPFRTGSRMTIYRSTRGTGLLEGLLARMRCRLADRLIPKRQRSGCIVDLGCGAHPLFLVSTHFAKKVGVDYRVDVHLIDEYGTSGIELIKHDLECGEPLPLDKECCRVVTMLALIEHISEDRLVPMLQEVHRILAYGGIVLVTTPSPWGGHILPYLARLGLVSREEIHDHKTQFTLDTLRSHLMSAGFSAHSLRFGYFELFMNSWATAVKTV